MSCLTAFLLVTAVWVNLARLEVETTGKAKQGEPCTDDECPVKLSVLVEADEIWLGVSRVNEFEKIARRADGSHDFDQLEARLRAHKSSAFFRDTTAIEVAAASSTQAPVNYQALISTMDIAVKAGFSSVGITDPDGLSARPML
jgi:biopolymer transport protein ExbD